MTTNAATLKFNNAYLESSATVVGEMEMNGPLSSFFDVKNSDPYFGMKSWEQAESHMVELAIKQALNKKRLAFADVGIGFGGDLVNQLVPTHYAMRQFDIPFMGVYSACASIVEALTLASVFVDKDLATRALAFSSSHNNMAEKQFRTPVEYGGPKGDAAQHTATGAGAGVVSRLPADIKIESATIGIVIDAMQKDPADMGSAMAPAAAHTINRHLKELKINSNYYDLILTGDLARIGSQIVIDLLKRDGYDISKRHNDCGSLLYSEDQPVFAGGSGAGCPTIVIFGYIVDQLRKKALNKVLIVATGALLNPLIVAQKETIPCIAHAIAFSAIND